MDFFNNDGQKKSETKTARLMGEKLAKKYFTNPAVPIREFLKEEYEFTIIEMELSDNIYALVDLDDKEIVLNTNQGINRCRFTLAHELGHIVLNHKIRKWTEYSNYIGTNPDQPLEEEANAFASGFLMPGDWLRHFVKEGLSPADLAKLFQVSQEALWYSLETNRLINKVLK